MVKKTKLLILLLCMITALTVLISGCAKKTPTPAPMPQPAPQPATQATFAGTDACTKCHANQAGTFGKTSHATTFKPLSAYPTTKPLGPITVFDYENKEAPKSTTIDLSKAKIHGVMVDDYIVAEMPAEAGFKAGNLYRVAALHKTGDKWELRPAKEGDFDKDGKPDWGAASFAACNACHSPGLKAGYKELSVSCESCHGPGSAHAAAPAKGNINKGTESCTPCHQKGQPTKNATTGGYEAQNHYGTRDFFASAHAKAEKTKNCGGCHNPHAANPEGKMLTAANAGAVCATCHQGKKYDLTKLMWKNPTDPNNHITKDHSFGAIKYEDLGDDPKTKQVEITKQETIDKMKNLGGIQ